MRIAAFGLALAALAAPTVSIADTGAGSNEDLAVIRAFQAKDQRLQDAGWALTRGNAEFCTDAIPAIGLQLQDIQSYGKPGAAKLALGLAGDFAVETAAKGSPAALTGAFPPNREVTQIANTPLNQWPNEKSRRWERLTRAHDFIDERLAKDSAVTVTFADGSAQSVGAVPACATRFELLGDSKRAVADGARVVIGSQFPAFDWDDDPAFAGLVAHELAHNLLGHRAWLDRNTRKFRHVRLTEREADRLMPWLLANAGYDPQAAVSFMERWGKNHSKGFFRNRAYEGWDERAEHIAAEIPLLNAVMAREGKADWSKHFRREIDPDLGQD